MTSVLRSAPYPEREPGLCYVVPGYIEAGDALYNLQCSRIQQFVCSWLQLLLNQARVTRKPC
jgi:hypothetical protein